MSPLSRPLRLSLSPLLALLVTSCMLVGRNYTSPDMITPDSWHQSLHSDLNSGSSSLRKWWTRFNDPTLNRLVRTAKDSNRDLAIAYERINDAVLIATNLLAREDGAWKMIHHQSGPTPPPTEYASPAPPHRLN